MQTADLNMEKAHVHKLLCAASGDAALLYIYLRSGNPLSSAEKELELNASRLQCALATLRQLGLYEEHKPILMVGERPQYSETDVFIASETDMDFTAIYKEVQKLLGKPLTTEELKILLGMVRYLGLPGDVIIVLIGYCKDRARERNGRNPSLRTIEKEAYAWAEKGIDTMEEAIAYMKAQAIRRSRLGRLKEQLQIYGRNFTPGEEKYAQRWLDWGFDEEAISMAYDRTCLNTGGLSWAYMNKILTRWQTAGLLTGEQIRTGDRKPGTGTKAGQRTLDSDELAAIERMFTEV